MEGFQLSALAINPNPVLARIIQGSGFALTLPCVCVVDPMPETLNLTLLETLNPKRKPKTVKHKPEGLHFHKPPTKSF